MAYVGNSITLVTPSIEGSFSVFAYVTTDSVAPTWKWFPQ